MKRLSTKYLFFALLVAFACESRWGWAQMREGFDTERWLYGKVVLTSGDSLQGAVIYHPAKDVVQIASEDGTINSLSAVNVSHFMISGVYDGKPQIFRSLPWNRGSFQSDFRVPVFFEQINQGELMLMKRYVGVTAAKGEQHQQQATASLQTHYFPHFATAGDELQEILYVMLPDGEIVQLRKHKKDLLKLCGTQAGKVKQYVKANKLDYNNSKDLLSIVDYYNSL
ncbi:hypothetical protein [Pontibacter lucknowensis]|uniref:DUF4369 domain-containing protein n=2 Tax=Pontibacter TaxID=323449 RepID=A0A1N6Y8F4_9BACT|nr:hypothetical protein [Pontibacter lucknowensis]SIR10857.1 hypothetical protein SAMN05421545_2338 [Pontibacter lucknowensis]